MHRIKEKEKKRKNREEEEESRVLLVNIICKIKKLVVSFPLGNPSYGS